MTKVDGIKIAEEILDKIKKQEKPKGKLAVVLVGENKASESFIKIKERTAKELGVDFKVYKFEEDISNEKLREEVGKIAKQGVVGGVVVQLPLPEKLNRQKILNAVPVEKDVDVLSEKALGAFSLGKSKVLPPAVGTVLEILQKKGLDSRLRGNDPPSLKLRRGEAGGRGNDNGLKVAVVGMGFLVGKPVATWLQGKAKKVTVFDEGSDLKELKDYDLVISGAGKAGIIKVNDLKEGARVIDFGYDNGKGDLEEDNKDKLDWWTPTPKGTGPILVAKLFENFYKLEKENK